MSKQIQKGNDALVKGNALFNKGEYQNAAESFKVAVKSYEDAKAAGETPETKNIDAATNNLSLTYNKIGIKHLSDGNTTEAITAFKGAVNANDKSFDANYNLGFAHKQAGNFAEAITFFQVANTITVGNFSVLYNLAQCQKETGKNSDAIETLKESLKCTSDVSNLLTVHCKIIESAGKIDTAALNSAAKEAFDYASKAGDITSKAQLNYIMVHYGKLCLADSSTAAANLNNIADLYAKVNTSGETLFKALIDFIYNDYNADRDIAKAEHQLGHLVINDKETGVFAAVKEAAKLIAQQDDKYKDLAESIILVEDNVQSLGKILETVS